MFLVKKYVKVKAADVEQGIQVLSAAGGWENEPGPQGKSEGNVMDCSLLQ